MILKKIISHSPQRQSSPTALAFSSVHAVQNRGISSASHRLNPDDLFYTSDVEDDEEESISSGGDYPVSCQRKFEEHNSVRIDTFQQLCNESSTSETYTFDFKTAIRTTKTRLSTEEQPNRKLRLKRRLKNLQFLSMLVSNSKVTLKGVYGCYL